MRSDKIAKSIMKLAKALVGQELPSNVMVGVHSFEDGKFYPEGRYPFGDESKAISAAKNYLKEGYDVVVWQGDSLLAYGGKFNQKSAMKSGTGTVNRLTKTAPKVKVIRAAASAKKLAEKAAKILLKGDAGSREWDSCFEMGNSSAVIAELQKITNSDPDVEMAARRQKRYLPEGVLTASRRGRFASLVAKEMDKMDRTKTAKGLIGLAKKLVGAAIDEDEIWDEIREWFGRNYSQIPDEVEDAWDNWLEDFRGWKREIDTILNDYGLPEFDKWRGKKWRNIR